MSNPRDPSEADDKAIADDKASALESALAEYLLEAESGKAVHPEEFCARYPALETELRDFIQMDQQFRSQRMEQKYSVSRINAAAPFRHATRTAANERGIGNEPEGSFWSRALQPLFGDYETLEEISRGGMGIVFRARHRSLRRIVAVKLLIGGSFSSEEARRRFRREAAAAARLSHPNIVPVYEAGEVESEGSSHGQLWFAMALVDGVDLAKKIEENLFDAHSAARLIATVADAVHYAHSRGVIHRDLKPANILLERDGTPRITDFGLSRVQDDDASQLTETGQIFGTPSFMAPEQAQGNASSISAASDIFALGAVLYCMLTGKPPFRGHSTVATLHQVIHETPVPPRLLNPQVPADLEAIILKCLEKQPEDRYATATELCEDLERFLSGESVSAASVNVMGYFVRVLAGSRNSEFLEGWARSLYLMAAVVLISHVALHFLPSTWIAVLSVATLKYAAMLAIVWYARSGILTPQNPVERTIWNLWIGYMMTFVTAELMTRISSTSLSVHAIASLTSSVILMVLGGQVWGACYIIAVSFLASAVVLTLFPAAGPLLFGTLWTMTFALLARRCHRRAKMG
ncbi:MAG: serine/threonine protein kinase [Planctomycetaceae bacterium]|nr:serine/threonine protein kinase [Planctomycetaceae bacterium]